MILNPARPAHVVKLLLELLFIVWKEIEQYLQTQEKHQSNPFGVREKLGEKPLNENERSSCRVDLSGRPIIPAEPNEPREPHKPRRAHLELAMDDQENHMCNL